MKVGVADTRLPPSSVGVSVIPEAPAAAVCGVMAPRIRILIWFAMLPAPASWAYYVNTDSSVAARANPGFHLVTRRFAIVVAEMAIYFLLPRALLVEDVDSPRVVFAQPCFLVGVVVGHGVDLLPVRQLDFLDLVPGRLLRPEDRTRAQADTALLAGFLVLVDLLALFLERALARRDV